MFEKNIPHHIPVVASGLDGPFIITTAKIYTNGILNNHILAKFVIMIGTVYPDP